MRSFGVEGVPRPRHDAPGGDPRGRGAARPRAARSSSRRRSRARRSRRARTRTTSGRRRRAAGSGWRSPTPAPSSRRSRASGASGPSFRGEPTIGGRYSALSPFGMVPAALMGIDLAAPARRRARDGARPAARARGTRASSSGSAGARAGARAATRSASRAAAASASGPSSCSRSRPASRARGSSRARASRATGDDRQTPGVELERPVRARQGVLPLGVRDRGRRARARHQPVRPAERPGGEGPHEGAARPRRRAAARAGGVAEELFAQARDGDYVCIQAFVEPSAANDARLAALVERARATATGCVVDARLGPRYLHSTGQLHKGGPDTGLFLQVVDDTGEELPIPGSRSASAG